MAKEIKKFLPCGMYDVERIETFLNDMSKEGLNIQKEGIFMNVVYFEKSNERMYYHLVPKFQKTKEENAFKEEVDQKGYIYIDSISNYYIFAHNKPFMIDDCDKAYKALKKSIPNSLISTLFSIILFIAFDIDRTLLLFMINVGTFVSIGIVLLFLLYLIRQVNQHMINLDLLKKYQTKEMREEKDWYSTKIISPIYYYFRIFVACIVFMFMCGLLMDKEMTALNSEINPPFVTLDIFETEDLDYLQDTHNSFVGGYRRYSDILSPINYEWEETGNYSPGENNYAILFADYHKTIHEVLASELVKEYRYLNLHHDTYNYQELQVDASKYGFDELVVFEQGQHRVYIIRMGKEVLSFDLTWRNDMHQIGYVLEKISQSDVYTINKESVLMN